MFLVSSQHSRKSAASGAELARVVVFENDCAQRPAGLENNARLIRRYERMLTKRLHARIRECTGLEGKSLKSLGRSL